MIKHRRIHQKNTNFMGKFKEKGEFFIFFISKQQNSNAFSFDVITVKFVKFVLYFLRFFGSLVVEHLFCTPEVPSLSLSCAKKFFVIFHEHRFKSTLRMKFLALNSTQYLNISRCFPFNTDKCKLSESWRKLAEKGEIHHFVICM